VGGGTAPRVTIEAGRKVLRVGGIIQSVAVDSSYTADVWDALLPPDRPASALILGLGGGTVALLMTQRWGPLPITGVEWDPAVAWLAQHEFGLAALPHVRVEIADAFAYVRRCTEQYDAICVDLYTAGKLSHGVLGGTFLRDIERILTPSGTVMFNFWRSSHVRDQIRRVERYLDVWDVIEVDDNIVVRCRRREQGT
jgi:spermidine synthase